MALENDGSALAVKDLVRVTPSSSMFAMIVGDVSEEEPDIVNGTWGLS